MSIFRSSIIAKNLYDLPTPRNLALSYGMGSMIGVFYGAQVVSGLFLSFFYRTAHPFESIQYLQREVWGGWFFLNCHAAGASLILGMLIMHMFRGIYHGSYSRLPRVWGTGVVGLLLFMASAFLGYVLPWGQMSFWGATVIINLLGVIPHFGDPITNLLWGGYSVGSPTVVRFFSFHYVASLACAPVILLHMALLHTNGSGNPTGARSVHFSTFHPHSSSMDLTALSLASLVTVWLSTTGSSVFANIDNKVASNPMVTPVSIEPEWYFLPFYAVLRAIPHKTGGVICMTAAILVLLVLPLFRPMSSMHSMSFFSNFLALLWLGANPPAYPFLPLSQYHTSLYFIILFANYGVPDKSTLLMWAIMT